MATPILTDAQRAKVVEYVGKKDPPHVYSQNPSAGTAVAEGTTIELTMASNSDIPLFVIDEEAPILIKNLPIAEIEKAIDEDPLLKDVAKKPTVAEADRQAVANTIKERFAPAGTIVDPAEAEKYAKTFNMIYNK